VGKIGKIIQFTVYSYISLFGSKDCGNFGGLQMELGLVTKILDKSGGLET